MRHRDPPEQFADRAQAGRALAGRLLRGSQARTRDGPRSDAVVLGLVRGGVPVAFEVALALGAPLDLLIARKISAPSNRELGVGALAEGGIRVLFESSASELGSEEELRRSVAQAEREVEAAIRRYRSIYPPVALAGKTAIVVDDGLATGATAIVAVRAARARGATKIVLATPVGARTTIARLREEADEVIGVIEPDPVWAIGVWYRDFTQVPESEVLRLMAIAANRA